MAVNEKAGLVVADAKRVGRSPRTRPLIGGTEGNQDGNVVKLPISPDRDQLLPAATRKALETLPEYLYRGF